LTEQKSERSRAFKFGLGALILLGAAGALLYWRKHHAIAGGIVSGVGAAIFLLALLAPAGALAVRGVWMRFAGVLGYINSRIILGILFFLLVTPIALVRRLRGREAYRFERKGGGNWRKRDKPYDPKHYEHPY
jgi:hypothetical protein